MVQERYFFKAGQQLNQAAPTEMAAQDNYTVDFSVSTGTNNRWITQLGEDILRLHDRGDMDAKMLTYTSEPLTTDVQISGAPVVSLQLSSSQEDGLVLVYLEDVDENGQSRYLTEGGLRLIHQKETMNPNFPQSTPYHSFLEADAAPMPTNEVVEVNFQLLSTSVLIKAGHRIRIAIAGGDQNIFDRIPATGIPEWTISRNATQASFIDLPIVK